MTKNALIEYVRVAILNREAIADNQSVTHFQRVSQGINYAFDTLLSQIKGIEGDAEIESYYLKNYYDQDVKESGDYRYVGISDDIANIQGGRGIWYVQPKGGGVNFSRIKRPDIAMFNSLPVGEILNETFWRLGNVATNKQIILEDISDSPFTDIRKVDYGIVRAFSSYTGDEEVYIPDTNILIGLVLSWFAEAANDNINDNKNA